MPPQCPPRKSAEENFAEQQQAQGLPEADDVQPEDGRHEPIPKVHDDEAERQRGDDGEQDEFCGARETMSTQDLFFTSTFQF